MKKIEKESASQRTIDNSNHQQETGCMIAGLIVWFVISLFISAVLTALIAVPFLGMIPFLLTLPLHFVWPELGYTSELVEYGPFWITIKQSWLWPVFFAYFFVVAFFPGFLILLLRLRRRYSITNG